MTHTVTTHTAIGLPGISFRILTQNARQACGNALLLAELLSLNCWGLFRAGHGDALLEASQLRPGLQSTGVWAGSGRQRRKN